MRLVATDMDGTLLNARHEISNRNKQAVLDMQAKGIDVIVATGRSFPEAYIPVKRAGLTLPYICINGAEIRNESKQVIGSTHLLPKDISRAMATLNKYEVYFDLFIDEYVYVLSIEKQIDMFIKIGSSAEQSVPEDTIRQTVYSRVEQGFIREVGSYDSILQEHGETVYKMLGICTDDRQFKQATRELEAFEQLAISSSGKGIIEITHVNAQKGIALEKYATSKGIDMRDVMVIGDNYNDISMMEKAGISVAMENAPDDIKAICTHETSTSEKDGFAQAIETIL